MKERDHLGHLSIDESITLMHILNKSDEKCGLVLFSSGYRLEAKSREHGSKLLSNLEGRGIS
jgi:hypothetical protein